MTSKRPPYLPTHLPNLGLRNSNTFNGSLQRNKGDFAAYASVKSKELDIMKHSRQVAVVVCVAIPSGQSNMAGLNESGKSDEVMFLVVQSRRHPNRWVCPKGGIETGETSEQAGMNFAP